MTFLNQLLSDEFHIIYDVSDTQKIWAIGTTSKQYADMACVSIGLMTESSPEP